MRLLLPILLGLSLAALAEQRGDHPDAKPSTPQEQLAQFHVPPGFEVQLVAAEPDIQKPINLTFDAAGQLWVTGSEMYPWPASTDANGQPIPDFEQGWQGLVESFKVGVQAPQPAREGRDSVRVLADFDTTGRARKITVFADKLNIPGGVQPLPHGSPTIAAAYGLGPAFDPNPAMEKRGPIAERHLGKTPKGDSAIVYSIPNIWLMSDWDGDGLAESRLPLYTGFGYTDTHGGSSSYLHWIDGWIYGTHGFKNHSEVRDREGRVTVLDSGNTYRFKPDGSAFEIYTHGQTNPFGLTVDPLGNFYSADSHSKPVYLLLRGGYYEGIGKKDDGLGFAPRITDDDHGSSAIAGIAYYADDKFPEEYRGNLFNGNPVTQKINRDKLVWHGSTPKAIRQPDFLSCDDPWFRPVQVKLGPDGALYIADFYNPIIGHYEVPLTDPRRDHTHGRIWRVVWRGESNTPAPPMPDLTKKSQDELVALLGAANLEVQRLATNELVTQLEASGAKRDTPLARAMSAGPDLGADRERAQSFWTLKANDDLAGGTMIHFLAGRGEMSAGAVASRASEALLQRAFADDVARRPTETGFFSLLQSLESAPAGPDDSELVYARRVGIREALQSPEGYQWAAKRREADDDSDILSEVSLAVPTPEAADFLLAQLERTKLAAPRAGEYLKHVAQHLPEEKFGAVFELIAHFGEAALPQRLALADGLAQAVRQREISLPVEIAVWTQRAMLEALASSDETLVRRGIEAVRDAKLDAKLDPLTRIVRDDKRKNTLRLAALEAAANLPASRELLATTLDESQQKTMRKRAAELLAQNGHTGVVLAALPNAPAELALAICGALARSDAGATALLDAIVAGKTAPRLLLNKAVAGPLGTRPNALRTRAAALTKDLPPEDARLNAVIAERTATFLKARPDATHGAEVFQQNCAACHRFRNAGGNVGPNLDGVIARGPARLIEDILDPNLNVDPLFRQTTFETTDGDILLGANLRDQGDAILFADPTGKDVTIPKAKIKKQTASGLSLMPPIFESAIPIGDFYDLLAYLLNPAANP